MYGYTSYGGADGYGPATLTSVRYLTATESISSSDSLLKTIVKIFSESLTLTEVFLKTIIVPLLESFSLSILVTLYLNGYPVGVWAKVVRAVVSWTNEARAATTWVKTPKS